jgi:predicted O-methyltransferase YrrM
MHTLPISAQALSSVVWRYLFASIDFELASAKIKLSAAMEECEKTRVLMSKKTGSISLASSIALYSVVRSIKPQTIFELGTFIGNSTISMALALDGNGSGDIYTCDGDNNFHLPNISKSNIYPYPRTNSLVALKDLAQKKIPIDMLFVDGRITPEDAYAMAELSHDRTFVVIDDFEGMEKGVANLMVLRSIPQFSQYALVHPPAASLIDDLGLLSGSAIALLLPKSALRFTAQDSPYSN